MEDNNRSATFALAYARRGFHPVPIPLRGKNPGDSRAGGFGAGWQQSTIDESAVGKYWDREKNIGVLLGEPSGGLVDIDLDAEHAIRIARFFLPGTQAKFGRKSKPVSHWLYIASPLPKTERLKAPGGEVLVELRSTGGQTVFPGSIHESGEAVEWVGCSADTFQPTEVEGEELRRGIYRLAAAALLAKNWPSQGGRHDAALALAGLLMHEGLVAQDAETFIEGVCVGAGDDESADRVRCVKDTYAKLANGEAVQSAGTLAKIIDQRVVSTAENWLSQSLPDSLMQRANGPGLSGFAPRQQAKKQPTASDDMFSQAAVATAEPPTTANNLKVLRNIIGVDVTRIVKIDSDNPSYFLETSLGTVTLRTISSLIEQALFKKAMAAATTYLMPKIEGDRWHRAAQIMLQEAEVQDAGDDAREVGELLAWLEGYCTSRGVVDIARVAANEGEEAARDVRTRAIVNHEPYCDGEHLYFSGSALRMWLATKWQKLTAQELGYRVRRASGEPWQVKFGKSTTRHLYRIALPTVGFAVL